MTAIPVVTVTYAQALFGAAFMAVGCVFFIVLAAWFLLCRKAAPRDRLAAAICLALAVLFGVQAGFLGVVAYDQYLVQGQQHHYYQLYLRGNATLREGVVVPIPEDESLLANLRVDAGQANWSLVDTFHGRGLYVSFVGSANLRAEFTEFSPAGRTRDDTPTMGNVTTGCMRSAYFFVDGPREVLVDLSIDDCFLHAAAIPGWSSGEFYCCPPVAVP